MGPAPVDQVSEQASLLKSVYPRRTDKYGMKFGKGFRTAVQVRGQRPVTRTARRALRGV